MSFNENDFYPDGAQGSSSSSSSSEPATPWLRKDELAEALEDIEEPPADATQKTVRQRLAGLIGRLKSISPALVLNFTFFILHSTFADTIPWEEVPPDTPVDTDALVVAAETDPVFTAWAGANTNELGVKTAQYAIALQENGPYRPGTYPWIMNHIPSASAILQDASNYTDRAVATRTTPETVTNIVRDLSLGGIWDEQIQVWWTPRMHNGSLTYEATTNVNLNAED